MRVRNHIVWWVGVLVALMVSACANKGAGPQGGPKDMTPPKVVSCSPKNGSVNWQKKKVEIEFNENIQVDRPSDNVVISPAQRKFPSILAVGKKVQVVFSDTLQPNTTYTIDFGRAVKDNNEGNVLDGYSFSFSTGSGVDTLQVSGQVIDALTQTPQKGIFVGLYRDSAWQDSTFMLKNMERIGKTNDDGRFRIIGIAPGRYRVFALDDKNKSYRYDRGEALAVLDSTISPWVEAGTIQDTLWRDTATIDTVMTIPATFYHPNNLTLKLFKEIRRRQYLAKSERPDSTHFILKFNDKLTTLPQLVMLDSGARNQDLPFRLQINENVDSLVYWITDKGLLSQDTLRLICTYEKSDSLFHLVGQTDTLKLVYHRPQLSERAKKILAKKGPQPHYLKVSSNAKSPFEQTEHLYVETDAPLDSIDRDSILLWAVVNDSTKTLVDYELQAVDSSKQKYELVNHWEGGMTYLLQVDSAALRDIYGNVNQVMKTDFKVRPKEEYATLTIKVVPCDSSIVLQLLDARDNVVQTRRVRPSGAQFDYLLAGEYKLRCFKDWDGDGEWTTGDYFERRKPEEVIYYPDGLTLRANWEFEETWSFQ